MKVLVACEESQTVCKAFRARGHEAYSCDTQEPSGGHPEWHIRWDAVALVNGNCSFLTMDGTMHHIDGKWDLLIAHPPCTYLTNAGAVRMRVNGEIVPERYQKAMEAKAFFLQFLNADCQRIAVENPTPMKIVDLPPYTQAIQPWQFGHPYSKRTCLWLKGLPKLYPNANRYQSRTVCKWWMQGRSRKLPQIPGQKRTRSENSFKDLPRYCKSYGGTVGWPAMRIVGRSC